MKTIYCWRCGMEVPMLEEDEFAVVEQVGEEQEAKVESQTPSAEAEAV